MQWGTLSYIAGMRTRLYLCVLASALLHLLVLWLSEQVPPDQSLELYRVQQPASRRFEPPRRARLPWPRAAMEYRAPEARAVEPDDASITSAEVEDLQVADATDALTEAVAAGSTKDLKLETELMPSPTTRPGEDTVATAALDLVRIEDLMAADALRAVVIPDPDSVRATRGFIKFTPLYLDGAWSYLADSTSIGRPVLEDLAQYMRHNTGLHAEIRSIPARAFLSNELLKDPVHFLFPDINKANQPRVRLAPEERVLLRTYLNEGGFLLIDAGGGSDDRRFLMAWVEILQQTLASDGRLTELPVEHEVYRAFYDLAGGFPGEDKHALMDWPFDRPWYYPDRFPGDPIARGLWGITLDDRLVGIISDLNLHLGWSPPEQAETVSEAADGSQVVTVAPPSRSSVPQLQAGVNILFYALLRPDGLAVKQRRAWDR